ncbi:4'-phosphopantetheinyl transferase superfamily protein [Cryomorphaceae bacterium 1068]|nr:4'-phosphopantetheinyl transferase superfamily protein [Cryomorphaceae bacterium 1068]
MPLHYHRSHSDCEVTLWKITEEASYFRNKLIDEGFPTEVGDRIKRPEKALQWYASRFLLITSHPAAIDFYKERKPHLYNGPQISFSHSDNVVGLMLSQKNAGLDVQVFNDKLKKIQDKFTNSEELKQIKAPSELAALSLTWSIKEAVFKYYGTGVPFKAVIIENHDPVTNTVNVSLPRQDRTAVHTLFGDFLDDLSLAYVLE